MWFYGNIIKSSFRRKGKKTNRFELSLRTHEANGLLLWTNKGNSLQESFLAVAIVDGFPELCLNLGKKEIFQTIRSKVGQTIIKVTLYIISFYIILYYIFL